ncbi:MAG: hypothetical protein CM1200mP2_21150 [Planctomycetaceae bacterium]|nr:MAG: hypothetical protein CM1200mP2_21150 [Planctomycetaceae bacterium]
MGNQPAPAHRGPPSPPHPPRSSPRVQLDPKTLSRILHAAKGSTRVPRRIRHSPPAGRSQNRPVGQALRPVKRTVRTWPPALRSPVPLRWPATPSTGSRGHVPFDKRGSVAASSGVPDHRCNPTTSGWTSPSSASRPSRRRTNDATLSSPAPRRRPTNGSHAIPSLPRHEKIGDQVRAGFSESPQLKTLGNRLWTTGTTTREPRNSGSVPIS